MKLISKDVVSLKANFYSRGEKILESACVITKITQIWDFLCGPLAQTLSSQSRGPRFIPWSENLTLHAATKELHNATKIKGPACHN